EREAAVLLCARLREQGLATVLSLLSSGASVLCHCRGGVGRAGLLASCVLLAAGISAAPCDAIALVRKRRCYCHAGAPSILTLRDSDHI
ncbi:protein tyrosine phosphatase, partial [Perkinsus sp. BL_2016]